MNTEKGIALACFMGAALGALLALQWGHFWWIGILAGGALGYLCFRFRELVRAVSRVWKSLPDAQAATAAVGSGIWSFLRVTGAAFAILCLGCSILIMIVGVAMSLVGTEMPASGQGQAMVTEEVRIPPQHWALGAAGFMLAAALLVFCVILASRDRKAACRTILNCFLLTPLALPFTLAFAVGSALLPHASKACVRLSLLVFKTAQQTFILVHSELRLLCMTDAMIGALVGFFCGSALIGGIVGALCGLANYKLVSVRWLKLVKA